MLHIKILKLLNLLESLHFQHFEMICTDESSTDDQKWMKNVNFWCHVDFNKKIVQTIRVLMTYRTHHLTLVLIHWPSGYTTRDQTSHSTLHSCPWRDIISRPCLWASQLWVYVMPPSHLHRLQWVAAVLEGAVSHLTSWRTRRRSWQVLQTSLRPPGPYQRYLSNIHREKYIRRDENTETEALKPRFQTHLSCAWPIYWRGQTSGFHHSPLPQLKKKTT